MAACLIVDKARDLQAADDLVAYVEDDNVNAEYARSC